MNIVYKQVVLGGTFDLLHDGHKTLLRKAFDVGMHVTIGLTTDQFNKSIDKRTYQNQDTRHNALEKFLNSEGFTSRFIIAPIDNIYGPSTLQSDLEVIVVSPETLENAKKVNVERIKRSLNPLTVEIIPFVTDSDQKVISSSRIRKGEINDHGLNIFEFLNQISGHPFSADIRQLLHAPFGKIIDKPDKIYLNSLHLTVGDITTQSFIKNGITPDISVVDLKTKRVKQFDTIMQLGFDTDTPTFKVTNPPGQISKELIETIKVCLNSPDHQIIQVEGEEDLAVLPLLLLSPLGTLLFYGQPNQGMVCIEISLDLKNQIMKFLS